MAKIGSSSQKIIFLIDEVDEFVANDAKEGYRITSIFRKLNQEGKASFILAGFWELYFHATSDNQSPLNNFGELMILEGLEKEACRELMVEPMRRIGVSYANEEMIENLIVYAGQRPNVLAIICSRVLQQLEGETIEQEDIERVLQNPKNTLAIYKLKRWENMSLDTHKNRLDRAIVYLTLNRETFCLEEVELALKERGVEIDVNLINESLERLVLGYVLLEERGVYGYVIPLFKDKLQESGKVEVLLAGELKALHNK